MLSLHLYFISKEFLRSRILKVFKILKCKKTNFSFHVPFLKAGSRRHACFQV